MRLLIIAAMAGAIAFTSSAFAQVTNLPLPTQKIAPATQPDMQVYPTTRNQVDHPKKIAGQLEPRSGQGAAPAEPGELRFGKSPDKDSAFNLEWQARALGDRALRILDRG